MQIAKLDRVLTAARRGAALFTSVLLFNVSIPAADAAPKLKSLDIVPTITEISLNAAGDLVASGTATVKKVGKPLKTVEFHDVPVSLALADDQTGAGMCPILDLMLGPIDLNLLGLHVVTSEICLKITAVEGGGLLGDLLCDISGLLQPGVPLDASTLLDEEVDVLGAILSGIINQALENLLDAAIADITQQHGPTCAILNLELGPVDLTLLGLNVHLDDCNDGPVTVDITAIRGQLLGNLLCGLVKGGGLNLGATLQNILDGLLGN